MATFSYSSYEPIISAAKTFTCKGCGYRLARKSESELPPYCPRCKCDILTGEQVDLQKFFHNEHADDDVKLTTHHQVRWSCNDCGHYGLKWVKSKSEHGMVCPNCESTMVGVRKLPAAGRGKSVWGQMSDPLPQVKNKVFQCPHCGWKTLYKFKEPQVCNSCGNSVE